MRKPLVPSLVLLASFGLVALTGCSGPSEPAAEETSASTSQPSAPTSSKTPEAPATDAGQSIAEACQIASEAVLSVQDEIGTAVSNPTDSAAVVSALEKVESSLGGALEQISNPEVESTLSDVRGRFVDFTQKLIDAQAAGQPTPEQVAQLQASNGEVQSSVQQLQARCS